MLAGGGCGRPLLPPQVRFVPASPAGPLMLRWLQQLIGWVGVASLAVPGSAPCTLVPWSDFGELC